MSKPMLLLEAQCPSCNAALTEGQRVRLEAYCRETNEGGEVYLSAVFGDYAMTTDLAIPEGSAVEFSCPACDASLMLEVPCRLCGARMASLNLKTGGCVEFCTRAGCRAHALGGFGDVDEMMALVNTMLSTPHD